MAVAGETPAEISDAEAQVARLAAQFPNVSQTDILHMLRNARSIVGTYKEAADIAEPLVKLRTLAQLARPGEDVSDDFDKLIKGLEIKGVTQNPQQFQEYMEGIAKGINVFGDTLRPDDWYEMFKYGRQATPGLSEKFILGAGPTLSQELGGEGFGAAVSQFNRLLVSGVGKKGSFEELARLGLIEKGRRRGHSGHGRRAGPQGWAEGHGLAACSIRPERMGQAISHPGYGKGRYQGQGRAASRDRRAVPKSARRAARRSSRDSATAHRQGHGLARQGTGPERRGYGDPPGSWPRVARVEIVC
jgi:hypothetical protein